MNIEPHVALYATALLGIWGVYMTTKRRRHVRGVSMLVEAQEAGLTEPASLHPLIDPIKCLGCGACVRACPEGDILGMIGGKAVLVEPTQCIGHGACEAACPRGAISLVFGTSSRGVDIPLVGADFQSNVPGIFVAGELGGMGLIRNAIAQGVQAMDKIADRSANRAASRDDGTYDVVIVGAGPAGFAASLAAMQRGLSCVTIEQESFGGTVAHFPRGKIVMTAPAELPLVGPMRFTQVSKEELLGFWRSAAERTGLAVNYGERVTGVTEASGEFDVVTTQSQYRTRSILLAIGRRGTPRRLDVPGEELSKVVYRLVDPEQYRGQHVLVVGGGDSALEAAASVAEQPDTKVTLSYRGDAFQRAKSANRARVAAAESTGQLKVRLGSTVAMIGEGSVMLSEAGSMGELRNDAVIVCAGGVLPTPFLKAMGIEIETKYGTR